VLRSLYQGFSAIVESRARLRRFSAEWLRASVHAFVLVDGLIELVREGGCEIAAPCEDVAHVRLADTGSPCKVGGGRVAFGYIHDGAEPRLRDLAFKGLAVLRREGHDVHGVRFLFARGHGHIFALKSFSGMIVLECAGQGQAFPNGCAWP